MYFEFLWCERRFSWCYDIFCGFEAHDFHHFSPFSPPPPSLSSSSPLSLSSSPLCGLPSSLLWSFLLCLVLLSSFLCCFVLSLLLLLMRCRCWFCRRCSCCCCWNCWWVLRVFDRLLLVYGRFFLISVYFLCHSDHYWVVVRSTLRDALRVGELVITMMDDDDYSNSFWLLILISHVFAIFASWVETLTGQCKTLLSCVSDSWTIDMKISKREASSLSVRHDWQLKISWHDRTFDVTCGSAWTWCRSVINSIWSVLVLTRVVFVLRRKILSLKLHRFESEQSDMRLWSPRQVRTKDRSRFRCVDERVTNSAFQTAWLTSRWRTTWFFFVFFFFFPPYFIVEIMRINSECNIRILDDVILSHWMSSLDTDTSSWWWQEINMSSHVSRRFKTFLKERILSDKSGERRLTIVNPRVNWNCASWSCDQSQLSIQELSKRRASLDSFTDTWRALVSETIISSIVCDDFFWCRSVRLESRCNQASFFDGY